MDAALSSSSKQKLATMINSDVDPSTVFVPRFPQKLTELDVNAAFLADLALKAASLDADCTTASVAARIRLGLVITEALLERLYKEKLLEKKGVVALHNSQYGVLERGWAKVDQLMNVCNYVGPAPVSLQAYTEMIISQVRSRPTVSKAALEKAMGGLVLTDSCKRTLGVVASSGRSLFLSGPPGNGKTAMAHALVDAIPGFVWIPYALEIDGQVIRIFDSHDHVTVPHSDDNFDRRWVKIRPPLVVVGGELTLQSLELTHTETPRFYEAPFQLKANGGVLVVDDLGRQRCTAKELLNRWIVPLENRIDFLTLNTGKKIQVPLEQLIVFATNLTGADLEDEAFLRRMGYRHYVTPPTGESYAQIFQECAAAYGFSADAQLIRRVLDRYAAEGRMPKCCEPRDLILRAIDLCKYEGKQTELTDAIIAVAWESYFGSHGPPSANP